MSWVLLVMGVCLLVLPWVRNTNTRVKQVVTVLFAVLALRYLAWRFETASALAWSFRTGLIWVYLAFELWSMSFTIRDLQFFSHMRDRSADADEHAGWYEADPPHVDLLIPTYNESPDVLRRAVIGALRQDHGRTRVWVLDDGRRPWAREMCESRGARYLTRPDNAGYKAGNLNHALGVLERTEPPCQFFAVIDCDFVAARTFVSRTLSLMHDPSVAIVQTKQVYYNEDMFQYGLRAGKVLPDWLRFDFEVVLPCKEATGSSHCCGTSFLARAEPFRRIGGFPTETLSEDQLATRALRQEGFQTLYLSEGLSFGILAEGVSEFLTQRFRWCLGVYQNLFTQWGPLSPQPRPLLERMRGSERYVFGPIAMYMRVLLHVLLCAYWFMGNSALPLPSDPGAFVANFLPLFALHTLTMLWLSRGTDLPILSDAVMWVSWLAVMRATHRGLARSKNYRFVVTDKNVLKDDYVVHWRVLLPLLALILPLLAGMLYANVARYAPAANASLGAYLWSLYSLAGLGLAAALCVEPPQRRCEKRFDVRAPVELRARGRKLAATIRDISASGLCVQLQDATELVAGSDVDVLWDGLALSTRLVRADSATQYALAIDEGAARDDLSARLYSARYVDPPIAVESWRAPWAMFRKLVWD